MPRPLEGDSMKNQIIFLCGAVAGATFGGEFAAGVCALIIAEILLFLYGLSIVMEEEKEKKANEEG